jgi:hypothetical protein
MHDGTSNRVKNSIDEKRCVIHNLRELVVRPNKGRIKVTTTIRKDIKMFVFKQHGYFYEDKI